MGNFVTSVSSTIRTFSDASKRNRIQETRSIPLSPQKKLRSDRNNTNIVSQGCIFDPNIALKSQKGNIMPVFDDREYYITKICQMKKSNSIAGLEVRI